MNVSELIRWGGPAPRTVGRSRRLGSRGPGRRVTRTLVSPGTTRRHRAWNISAPLHVTALVSLFAEGEARCNGEPTDLADETNCRPLRRPPRPRPTEGASRVSARLDGHPAVPRRLSVPSSSADSSTRCPPETISMAVCERRVPLCNLKTLPFSPLYTIRDAVRGTIRATRSPRTRPPADGRYEQSVRLPHPTPR
jgi:hypothetical protein